MARILIVDDDEITRVVLSDIIGAEGHDVYAEPSLARGLKIAESIPIDLVFLDVFLPDGNGLEYLARFTQQPSNPLVIIITNAGDPNGAEMAIRNGAWDYVEKPFSPKDLQLSIRQAVAFREKKGDTLPVKRSRIVGSNPQLLQCIQEMSRAARSNVSVLVYGETGVGKDLFVRALHENCSVANGPFVIVDCASLHATIAGSELFGHKKGSFTSAVSANQGLIQQAHGGTLFLDEISELDLETQKLLLRVLETHRYRPLGEHHEVFSDFRFVCASNRDLEAMVSAGQFREDLFFRIREVTIRLPPLRERLSDLPELVEFFLEQACRSNKLGPKTVSSELMRMFGTYNWPGNVRELSHLIRALVSAAQTDAVIMPWHLPLELRALLIRSTLKGTAASQELSLKPASDFVDMNWKSFRAESLDKIELIYFRSLVDSYAGKISKMMAVSELSPAQLYRLLKKHGLTSRSKSLNTQNDSQES